MTDEHYEDEDRMKEDKILNNSYNTGDVEYNAFASSMKIDNRVSSQYSEALSENIVDLRIQQKIEKQIYEYFEPSEFYEKYRVRKRVDKGDMIKMYYFFKEKLLKEKSYSNMQIFIGFAEFFQINYDQLYTEIGVRDKEELLREMHETYGIKKKMQTKRLF